MSDPELRKRYDSLGYEAAKAGPEGGFADPREIFRQLFGGEPFVDIIGELSFVKMFMEEKESQTDGNDMEIDSMPYQQHQYRKSAREIKRKRQQEKREKERKIRKERVIILAGKLLKKLSIYTEGNYSALEFMEYIKQEALCLQKESLGTDLLHIIGYTYEIRARQHLGRDELLGLTGVWHSMRERGHSISNIFSTIKAASKAIHSARSIQEINDKAVENGTGPVEPPPELIREAGTNMRDLILKAVTFEVQSVIGDVCDEILLSKNSNLPNSSSLTKQMIKKRAEALKIIGSVYSTISPLPPGESNDFF